MGFLQTLLQNKYFYCIHWEQTLHIRCCINFGARLKKNIARKITKKCAEIWACIKIFYWPYIHHRCLILHVAINFIARKFTKKCAEIWACIKIFYWPNIYHRCLILHVAINFIARKFTKKCAEIWACIKIFYWPYTYHIKTLIV